MRASDETSVPADAAPGERRGRGFGLLAVALVAVSFLLLSYIPLRSGELWTHLIYGDWIAQNRALPAEDPVLELARGMPVTDTAWLSQLTLAGVYRVGGGEALSLLFALVVVATYLTVGDALRRVTRSSLWGAIGALLALAVSWVRLGTIRPESLAALAFAALIWIAVASGIWRAATRRDDAVAWSRWGWFAAPLVLGLWANLHGSAPIGVLFLVCLAIGRAIEVVWRRRRVAAAVADPGVRKLVWLAEIGFAATLVNPYGFDLWLRAATLATQAQLRALSEWQPLVLFGPGGRELVLSVVLLLVLLRHSPRRVPAASVLSLALAGWAAVASAGLLTWYGPVFALVATPLAAALMPSRTEPAAGERPLGEDRWRRIRIAIGALLIWVAFAVSPQGDRLLGGEGRGAAALYGRDAPLGATLFLRSRPPEGLVFAPHWWAGWLARQGPAGFRPFVAGQIDRVPPIVWSDYLRVEAADAGWESVLSKYRIDTAVLDTARQRQLVFLMRNHDGWATIYEEGGVAVFARRPPRSVTVRQPPPATGGGG